MTKDCVVCGQPFQARADEPAYRFKHRVSCSPECTAKRRRRMSRGFIDSPTAALMHREWDANP